MREDFCVHFNGVLQKVCRKGINYREITGGEDFGWIKRIPCREGSLIDCEHMRLPTAEEVAEVEERFKKSIEYINQIVADIRETKKSAGVIVCPSCYGPVHFQVSDLNGHIHAECHDCGINFME